MALLLVSFAVLAVFGYTELRSRVPRDLRADIVWTQVDGPLAKRTQAYRWYPLTYPILEKWSFGEEPTRVGYAIATIVHFGGPFARHWLYAAIERDPVDYYSLGPSSSDPTNPAFRHATGLDDPNERRKAVEAALEHFGKAEDDEYSFDIRLLASLGTDALPELDAWAKTAKLADLPKLSSVLPGQLDLSGFSPADAEIIARLRDLANRERLREAATAGQSTQTVKASAVFDAVVALNNNDRRSLPLLGSIVNGDLRRLGDAPSSDLIAVTQAFPKSRFTRGCLAYDALRGGTYFGRDDAADERLPTATSERWRRWLEQYPDHPGADDATYWLGRALQREGKRADALFAFSDALMRNVGDRDMDDAIRRRIRFLLDIGMSEDELGQFERRNPRSSFVPFARYARAVRRARANDFEGALQLARVSAFERSLRTAPTSAFARYFDDAATIYRDQRVRWARLAAVVAHDGNDSLARHEALAAAWNDDDGWKLGYLALFDGDREGGGLSYDTPDLRWPGLNAEAQRANQNAQTIALAKPLTAASVPSDIRRRNAARIIVALYRQQTAFPDNETETMGILPSLPPGPGKDASLATIGKIYGTPGGAFYALELREANTAVWWSRETAAAVDAFVHDYPDDPFAATALLSAYEVTGKTDYLSRVIASYPTGTRTEEARALLWRAVTP